MKKVNLNMNKLITPLLFLIEERKEECSVLFVYYQENKNTNHVCTCGSTCLIEDIIRKEMIYQTIFCWIIFFFFTLYAGLMEEI